METAIETKISEREQLESNSDVSSDTESIKSSSSGDSDSDSSLDSEDITLGAMSSSQFLILPKGDSDSMKFETMETIERLEDDDPTLTSSVCISSISSSTVSAVSQTSVKPTVPVRPEIELSYARDPYSPSSISHLLPSHLKEDQFVTVEEGDALVVLQELTDYLWIVRVCRTESIGIIPAWNVEGEFERIARINMELNARVLTPVAEFPPTDPQSSSSEDDSPTTPSSDSSPFRDSARPTKVRKLRSVDFAASQRKVMFRYPSERYVSGEWEQTPAPVTPTPESWYHGWIEGEEGEEMVPVATIPAPVEPVPVKQKVCRRGRKRNRKRVAPH